MAATLSLGACGLETIVAPEEAMESQQVAVDSNEATESSQGAAEPGETAEAPTAAGDRLAEGSSGTAIMACRRRPSPIPSADMPLIMVDGVRSEASFDEIAALDIESFKLVRGSDAVEVYGEDGRNGAILIFTKQSDGHGKDGGTPGEPAN